MDAYLSPELTPRQIRFAARWFLAEEVAVVVLRQRQRLLLLLRQRLDTRQARRQARRP